MILSLALIASCLIQLSSAFGGDVFVHDPSFIKAGSCWYVYSTGDDGFSGGNAQIRKECNSSGNFSRIGAEFSSQPSWIKGVIGTSPGNIWAPDINFWNNQYYLYYAASTFGSRNSAIGVASSSSPEGPWTDHGEVIHTTQSGSNYNAIDPDISWSYNGNNKVDPWMAFGSWSDGIKMRKIDPATGKLSSSDTKLYSLAKRDNGIEAASITHRNGFYYLFVSFDNCCKGVDSTYRIMVGRAHNITGPYTDKSGKDMMQGGATQLLATHGTVHGPGGQDVYQDGSTYRLVFHWYDGTDNGRAKIDIVDLNWADDWPTIGSQSKL